MNCEKNDIIKNKMAIKKGTSLSIASAPVNSLKYFIIMLLCGMKTNCFVFVLPYTGP